MLIVIYDGRCVLCQQSRRIINFFDRDGRIHFVDLHDRLRSKKHFPELDYHQAMGQIHVIDAAGHVHAGYFGIRRILRDLPLGYPLWLMLQLPGCDTVGKRLYAWVAKHRYQINRLLGINLETCDNDVCQVP